MEKQLKQKFTHVSVRGFSIIRWLLFIPAGLFIGGFAFGIVAAILTPPIPRGDSDLLSFGGVAAELISGFSSVLAGVVVAPYRTRIVASIAMGGASVAVSAMVLSVIWTMDIPNDRIYLLIAWVIYSSSAFITSIVFCKLGAAR